MNPRNPRYLEALVHECDPGATLVRTSAPDWERTVAGADRLYIVYPDAIGVGFGRLERRLAALGVAPDSAINGRRRTFSLDQATRRALRIRRLLERSFLVETLAVAALAIATPAIAGFDLVRGRR